MRLIEITSLESQELEVYGTLTEAQLRNRLEPAKGLFIAESPKVISVALDAGLEPVSLLCERKHIEGDASGIIERCPEEMPVYTGSRELLASLTGYTLTRGVQGSASYCRASWRMRHDERRRNLPFCGSFRN